MADPTLRRWLERLHTLQHERAQAPDEQELRAIALELGIPEHVLAEAEAEAERHLARGRNLFEHERAADAVAELELAVEMRPWDVEPLRWLARASSVCATRTGDRAQIDRARERVRRWLELEPESGEAAAILRALDAPGGSDLGRGSRYVRGALGALTVLAVLAGVAVLAPDAPEPTPLPPIATLPLPEPLVELKSRAELDAVRDLPITLVADEVPGLELPFARSSLQRFPERAFYKLSAMIRNGGGQELREIDGRLELLDEAGAVIATHALVLKPTYTPPLRPGDAKAVRALFEAPAAAKSARLVATRADEAAAARTYGASRPIGLEWAFERRSEVDLAVRERRHDISEGFDGNEFHRIDLEVENTGQTSIEWLKLEIGFLDATNRVALVDDVIVVATDEPRQDPGQLRLAGTTKSVPKGARGYVLRVVELR